MPLGEYINSAIKGNTEVGTYIPFDNNVGTYIPFDKVECKKHIIWEKHLYGFESLVYTLKFILEYKGSAIYIVCKDNRYRSKKKLKEIWRRD